ncbi:MAG: sigma-54-dependent Fis family transcriptional regulator [Candidatus Muiribacterium halophilum]|uniref:Sigma-54-dependent Fis family transcriptional regulator n=1 Tax=Muiribacterium halophilum TaxID=2053465 RepID=A0A2N5ZLE1_MUIH1|nr:MAG: sigma-54-dependent Fis family transcriptional regulator [Candidatus Muirbacterium halophilum]
MKKLLSATEEPLIPNMFLGESKEFIDVLEKLKKVAKVDSTILLSGESGTGKEMAARYIHENSPRKEKAFVPVNCASLSKELLGSELFGHKKGSFTGAIEEREGKFKAAHNGTIFLDEIGEIPLEIQAKLLRVLQEGEIEKIGEETPEKVDTRVIAATNRDLSDMVENGEFREDLFYRINVIEVPMPPLRDRKDDVILLAEFFIEKISERIGVESKMLDDNVAKLLKDYNWPGNIRELRNAIERGLVLSEDEILTEKDFKFLSKNKTENTEDKFESSERNIILSHIDKARNKTELARILGIKRTTLLYKLKKYEIDF